MNSIDTPTTSVRDRLVKIILDNTGKGANVAMCADRVDRDAAAGQILREFAVLHRSEETIRTMDNGNLECGSGDSIIGAVDGDEPSTLRNLAANAIALAEYLESAQGREAQRDKRRDAVAAEFATAPMGYNQLSRIAKRAIDRIIELEAAL